ncbi:MAG: ABC transporter ATP-binding protein [Halanaerobiales bacterium]
MSYEQREEESIESYSYWGLVKEFYKHYLKNYKYQFFGIQLLHAVIAILTLIPPLIMREMIDEAIPNGNVRRIITLVLFALAVFVVGALLRYLRVYHGHKVAQYVTRDMRNDLYNHYQYLSLDFHDNKKTGELMSRVIDDLNRLQEFVHHGPEAIIGSLVLLVGTIIILFSLTVKLTLVTLIYVPILLFFAYKLMQNMHQAFRKTRKAKAELNDRLEDNLAGIKVIKAFVNETFEFERFNDRNQQHAENRLEAIWYISILFPGSRLLNNFGILAILSYGAFLTLNGSITVGTIVAFYGYLLQFRTPLLRIVRMTQDLSRFYASVERFFSHIEIKPEIQCNEGDMKKDRLEGEVEFDNVYFSYIEDEGVLSGISFRAEPNQTVALVGPSGAGKTSIVRLIPRLYEVNGGQVMIDGIDVRDYELKELRKHIGMVMQEDFLFSDTVAQNIAYGRPDASQEEIVQAAEDANAHQFIKELKNGYDTQVGQRGIKLSGGQRQRISIARAFLKDPKILILDEATSSVDLETERLIQEAVDKVASGRTTFIIAHRLATIVNADMILFVENGKIKERGNHKELMACNGSYRRFYEMQFKGENAV